MLTNHSGVDLKLIEWSDLFRIRPVSITNFAGQYIVPEIIAIKMIILLF